MLRPRAFSLVEIMAVVGAIAVLASGGIAAASELLDRTGSADEARGVVMLLRKTRGEALREGRGAAVRLADGGQRLTFVVVDGASGCGDFDRGGPAARVIADVSLRRVRAALSQGSPVQTACFSSSSFVPILLDGNGPAPARLELSRRDGSALSSAFVGEPGTIESTYDAATTEGLASTGVRVAPAIDLLAPNAIQAPATFAGFVPSSTTVTASPAAAAAAAAAAGAPPCSGAAAPPPAPPPVGPPPPAVPPEPVAAPLPTSTPTPTSGPPPTAPPVGGGGCGGGGDGLSQMSLN